MSKQEKDYIKQIDELILNSSPDELKQLQEMDLKSQLTGKSLYDVILLDGAFGLTKITETPIDKKNHIR